MPQKEGLCPILNSDFLIASQAVVTHNLPREASERSDFDTIFLPTEISAAVSPEICCACRKSVSFSFLAPLTRLYLSLV